MSSTKGRFLPINGQLTSYNFDWKYYVWYNFPPYNCAIYYLYIAAFYYTLGNIRPEYRSSLSSIQLLGLVNSKHLKTYGVDAILEVLMKDLHQLEQVKFSNLVKLLVCYVVLNINGII